MTRYAAKTSVAAEQSRAEIERTLQRYEADQFMYGWQADGAMLAFRMHGRHVRFLVPMPRRDDPEFTTYKRGYSTYERTETEAHKRWEQATRQRWRALLLIIKARLEAVAAGISTFEREFLADTMLPDGRTVSEWMEPQIAEAYANGQMPSVLQLALPPGDDG